MHLVGFVYTITVRLLRHINSSGSTEESLEEKATTRRVLNLEIIMATGDLCHRLCNTFFDFERFSFPKDFSR